MGLHHFFIYERSDMDKKKNEDINLHIRISKDISEHLDEQCRISGSTKTGYIKSLLYNDLMNKNSK